MQETILVTHSKKAHMGLFCVCLGGVETRGLEPLSPR